MDLRTSKIPPVDIWSISCTRKCQNVQDVRVLIRHHTCWHRDAQSVCNSNFNHVVNVVTSSKKKYLCCRNLWKLYWQKHESMRTTDSCFIIRFQKDLALGEHRYLQEPSLVLSRAELRLVLHVQRPSERREQLGAAAHPAAHLRRIDGRESVDHSGRSLHLPRPLRAGLGTRFIQSSAFIASGHSLTISQQIHRNLQSPRIWWYPSHSSGSPKRTITSQHGTISTSAALLQFLSRHFLHEPDWRVLVHEW